MPGKACKLSEAPPASSVLQLTPDLPIPVLLQWGHLHLYSLKPQSSEAWGSVDKVLPLLVGATFIS